MAKAKLKFTRTGTFVETGECEVSVDTLKMGEIDRAARDSEFNRFVVQSRIYDDEAWRFEIIEVEDDKTTA